MKIVNIKLFTHLNINSKSNTNISFLGEEQSDSFISDCTLDLKSLKNEEDEPRFSQKQIKSIERRITPFNKRIV